MDCSPPGSSVHGDSPGKNTRVGCHALLQGIFLTQGLNPHPLCLLRWRVDSLPLVPPGKPRRKVIWAQRGTGTQRDTEALGPKAGESCLITSFITGFPPRYYPFCPALQLHPCSSGGIHHHLLLSPAEPRLLTHVLGEPGPSLSAPQQHGHHLGAC